MRLQKRAFFYLSLVFISICLLTNLSQPVRGENPQIHVASSLETARTFDSVLVMITSDPLPYGQNTTIASNHTVHFKFTNLGGQQEIYSEDLKLTAGIVTRTFRVDPTWGEFTGIIEVEDPLLNSVARTYIEIEYSTDWVIYLMNEQDKQNDKEQASRLKVIADQNSATVTIAVIMTVILVPMVLVKVQHTNARRRGDDSYFDRFFKRLFYYSDTTSRLTMFLTDPDYRHPTNARATFHVDELLERYYDAKEDGEFLTYEMEMIKHKLPIKLRDKL